MRRERTLAAAPACLYPAHRRSGCRTSYVDTRAPSLLIQASIDSGVGRRAWIIICPPGVDADEV